MPAGGLEQCDDAPGDGGAVVAAQTLRLTQPAGLSRR
jgi:hypothetical protein